MSIPAIPFLIVLLLFAAGVYSAYSKRNKLFCWFEGQDGTDEFKWVNIKDGNVIFRGFKYDIVPERITNLWLKSGIHFFFPTRVGCHKYVWYSRWPRNPKDYGRTIMNAQVRKTIDKSELVSSYFKTSTPSSNKKESVLSRWFPLIAIGVIVIMGFYFYSNMQSLSAGLTHIQNQINTLVK